MKSYKEFKEGFAHPNHKKLDANNNGKLDADDFKLLRKKKHEAGETPAQEKKEDCSMKEAIGGVGSFYSKSEKEREIGRDHDDEEEAFSRPKKTTSSKIYHKVPFTKKDDAKKEGMRFDPSNKKWYHTDANKSKSSSFVKESVDLMESEETRKNKKSISDALNRITAKAEANRPKAELDAKKMLASLKGSKWHTVKKEEVEELEEGNFEKNMDIIKSGKLPPHIQAILDKRGAKGNDAIMAKGRAEKLKKLKEMLDEARTKKEPAQVYHPTYSSAVQHARANAEKQGYTVSDDDWFHHVNSGPGKPSGGKTTRHVIPLQKDGKPSKKALAIQVHNRQTDKNSYELNSYIN